jgi:hypothetical protein
MRKNPDLHAQVLHRHSPPQRLGASDASPPLLASASHKRDFTVAAVVVAVALLLLVGVLTWRRRRSPRHPRAERGGA